MTSWYRGLAAAAAAVVFAVAGGSAALADQLAVDGDGLVNPSFVNGNPAYVAACTDQAVQFNVVIAARRNGGPSTNPNNNVFASGSTVHVAASSGTAGMTATLAVSSIVLPGDWQDRSTNYESPEKVTAVVTLPAQPMDGSGTYSFGYSGLNNAGTHVTGINTVAVTWTTQACSETDSAEPVLSLPADIVVEATGPSGAAVTFEAGATDETAPASPLVSCVPISGSTFPLGTTTVTCSASDAAGNLATGSFDVTVVDTTAPELSLPEDITTEATGPSGADVSFTATATDTVGPAEPVVTCDPASDTTFALGATIVSCWATDAAGNAATGSFTVTVEDTTAPVITWEGGPQDEASYVFGSVPAAGTCTALDLVDGNVSCTVNGYATTVGTHTLTATATDSRLNEATETRGYAVLAWTLSGFYSPVDMGTPEQPIYNTIKGGSTVPLKFDVFAGSTELMATSAVKSFTQANVTCEGGAGADDIEVTSTGGTSLRYDSTAGQYIQNWQTPKLPGSCYKVTMTTQDDSSISAYFKLK